MVGDIWYSPPRKVRDQQREIEDIKWLVRLAEACDGDGIEAGREVV